MIGSGLGHMTHALARVRHLRKTPGLGEGSGGKWGQLFPGEGGLAFVGMAGGSLGRGRSGSGTGEARPGGPKGDGLAALSSWARGPAPQRAQVACMASGSGSGLRPRPGTPGRGGRGWEAAGSMSESVLSSDNASFPLACHPPNALRGHTLFLKLPRNSKHLGLCGPSGLCHHYSTPPL